MTHEVLFKCENAVGTRNKAKVAKAESIFIIIPYCESQLFAHETLISTEKYIITSFYTIAESLNANYDCTYEVEESGVKLSNPG